MSHEGCAAWHKIRFNGAYYLTVVNLAGKDECIEVVSGEIRRVQLKSANVICTTGGYVEVVDLLFEDGTSSSCIRYDTFKFLDEDL